MPRSREEYLKAKRDGMAAYRARDPEAFRAKRKLWQDKNRDRIRQSLREYYAKRFFWGKAMKLRAKDRATYIDLARIWKKQRGLCALTGERLGRDAHLDHKLPKTRNGGDHPSNLQWVSPTVNLAKRDLTDAEFVALCVNVMEWIGERIQIVEAAE